MLHPCASLNMSVPLHAAGSSHMLLSPSLIPEPAMKVIDSECTVEGGVLWQGLLGPGESPIQVQLILWRQNIL